MVMDVASAELTKYASNAMLAVRISFMNELALLSERVGADIEKVRKAVGADPRIGPKFLFPGPGFGGSCFPKDIRALAHTARSAGMTLEVVEAADRANLRQKKVLGARVRDFFGGIVFETVIPRDVAAAEAPSHGRCVLDYAPRSRATRGYIELCMEVLERE